MDTSETKSASMEPTEKPGSVCSAGEPSIEEGQIPTPSTPLERIANRLQLAIGLEARGAQRVTDAERHKKLSVRDYLAMAELWFSINCTANNMTVGVLGGVAYGLGFTDAALCMTFGVIFGSICTSFIATFGPISGNRTLIIARYIMGWWPSRLCVLLNLVIMIGYGLVDTVVAGLILSAVNGHMTPIVGIVISALITWIVATFGIRWLHLLERYIWMTQVPILFILIGCAAPHFDTTTPSSASGATLAGLRLSYFFLCASVPLGWSPAAADFYVYYPASTSRKGVFLMTLAGLVVGKVFIAMIGIGLGCSLANNPSWADAFDISTGALYTEALAPLKGFGKFSAVLLALQISANNIPGIYASGLSWQMFGRWFLHVPRFVWVAVSTIIFTVCSIAGYAQLLTVFLNFLSLIGYWTIIWVTLTAEEHYIFRKGVYDWEAWNDKKKLPVGIAALLSFLVGWAGAIICMYQTYYTGPVAALVGSGADMGLPVGAAFTAVVYPPLRYLELKKLGR